jgi:hypothetical protein
MRARSLIAAVVCACGVLGWAVGHASTPAVAARQCPADVDAADRGIGVAAVAGRRLVGAAPASVAAAPASAVLRHVATTAEAVAYVEDRPGADTVVVAGHGTVRVLPQSGDAFHPTWSDAGDVAWGVDDRLVVRSASGREQAVPGPRPGGIVFAPVFVGTDIVAAVSAGPTHAVPEDGWSDDLWRFDGGRWHRVTSFPAGADRWSAIRTPFVAPDGSVEFVVVQGRGSESEFPRFSLWRANGRQVQRGAALERESYLAG